MIYHEIFNFIQVRHVHTVTLAALPNKPGQALIMPHFEILILCVAVLWHVHEISWRPSDAYLS